MSYRLIFSSGKAVVDAKRTASCFLMALFFLTLSWSPVSAQDKIAISGITEPIHDVTMGTQVAGTVANIFFKEGARVNKGEVILELDKELEELEVERRKLLWESKAELDSAVARVATLQSQLDGTKQLYESTGSVSKEDLEKQELELALAAAEKKRLENAEQREQIEYEMALEQLAKRSLRAPIPGTITELHLDLGETCEENQPLVHIVDTSQCLFVCTVEEKVGRTLKTGSFVNLEIQAGVESIPRKAKIIYVGPVVDAASGLQKIKAVFKNGNGIVHPGVSGVMLLDRNDTDANL